MLPFYSWSAVLVAAVLGIERDDLISCIEGTKPGEIEMTSRFLSQVGSTASSLCWR